MVTVTVTEMPTPPAGVAAGEARNDNVDQADDAVDDGHQQAADAVDNRHQEAANGLDDGLNLYFAPAAG